MLVRTRQLQNKIESGDKLNQACLKTGPDILALGVFFYKHCHLAITERFQNETVEDDPYEYHPIVTNKIRIWALAMCFRSSKKWKFKTILAMLRD